MKIIESKRTNNRYFLKIEGTPEEFEESLDKAFKKVVKNAKVSGFRKGKVPRNVFERHYGKGPIIEEGLQVLVNDCYIKAIKDLDLTVIDYPQNVDVSEYKPDQPVSFSCEVDVKPEIKLGKYKGVKFVHVPEEVTDEAVDKEISYIRDNAGKYEVTENAIKDQDISRANITARIGEESYADWTRENMGFKVGVNQYGSDFDPHVIGLKAGATKSFEVTYPDDFKAEGVAGKTVSFDVEVLENRSRISPELNDEFAKDHSQYETLQELKDGTRKSLTSTIEKREKDTIREKVLKAVVNTIEVEIQDVLVDRESENSLNQLNQTLRQSGSNLDQYCEITKKTVDDLKAEFREGSIQKLKTDLALEAIAKKEKIEVEHADLVEEIKRWNVGELTTDAAIESYLEKADRSQVEELVRRQKTIDFLIKTAKMSKK